MEVGHLFRESLEVFLLEGAFLFSWASMMLKATLFIGSLPLPWYFTVEMQTALLNADLD